MKRLFIFLTLSFSTFIFASSEKDKFQGKHFLTKEKYKHDNAISDFEIIPLNSPVQASTANFLIKVPEGFKLEVIKYKIKNANHLFEKDSPFYKTNPIDNTNGKEIHVPVSKLSPGFYQLYVKIKDGKNNEYDFKTNYKNHVPFVIDQKLEVKKPDPKTNNATLLGVDSDKDGIRDDVQRWINENFNDKPLTLKLALKQYATAMQSGLPTSNIKELSIQSSFETLKSQGCLYRSGDEAGLSGKEQEEIRKKIDLMYLNTKERIDAELQADANFHGQEVKVLSKEEACNF